MPSERPTGLDPHRHRLGHRLWSGARTAQLVLPIFRWCWPASTATVSVTPPSGPTGGPSAPSAPVADGPATGLVCGSVCDLQMKARK